MSFFFLQGALWGVAYEVVGRSDILRVLGYLNEREKELGGYTTLIEDFHSREGGEVIKVLVYTATQQNKLYLGHSNLAAMAMEIVKANGHAGSNIEYVTRLATYVRENIPEENDVHLFTLEKYVLYLKQHSNRVDHITLKPIIALTYDQLVDSVRT